MLGYIYRLFREPKKLDTNRVTDAVCKYLRRRGHWAVITNTYIHPKYEDDVCALKNRWVVNTEVKVSRGDFFRDFKKGKHRLIQKGRYPANYFYYACPQGLIKANEVPAWAGLLWVKDNGTVSKVKAAKRINRKPQRDRVILTIARKMDKKLKGK